MAETVAATPTDAELVAGCRRGDPEAWNTLVERFSRYVSAIATEGTDGLNFFIVASGEAAVTIHGEQVGTLGPGTAFGEVALVDKSARSATVTATTPMIAYALPVWSFRPFVEQRPELAWKLLEVLAERLRAANAR